MQGDRPPSVTSSPHGEPAPVATDAELAPGSRLGRYEIIGPIGRGSMGIVYEAHDPQLDRRVAVKVLHLDPLHRQSVAGSARLLREAQTLARLAHANVIAVHDVGEADGQTFVAMDLVRGSTLRQWLATPRPWREALSLLRLAGE